MHLVFSSAAVRSLHHALSLTLALIVGPSFAAEQTIPASAFFANPKMGGAELSPDGKHLAMLVSNEEGRDQLSVVRLADKSVKVVAAFTDADVDHFEWINNGRLLYDSRDNSVADGKEYYAPGLFAVNIDGTDTRKLADVGGYTIRMWDKLEKETLSWRTYMLGQRGAQDSNLVYVVSVRPGATDHADDKVELVELNTVDGGFETVGGPPGRTREWWLDAKGRPALATTLEGDVETLHYRDPKDGRWRVLATYGAYVNDGQSFEPLGFAPDGTLYVLSRRNRDKTALFAYDPATGKLAERPLVDLPDYDYSGSLVTNAAGLLGVRYTADALGTTWFDPVMKQAQEAVDKLLPGRINVLNVGARSETPFVLVTSWSDRQPSVFFLFNRDTGALSTLGKGFPGIDPARMAPLDLVRIKARDGRGIPTWVTIPNGSQGKKLPTVVLVHGGPYVRGSSWRWDSERQFLASRGYAVIEPEFRGSTGYGTDHFRAGWKQWGLTMQDDIADATRWAIAEGIAAPRRICIAGASYGGYSTLMGLIRDPDLYRCGVAWAGATDIDLLYTGHWATSDDTSDAYRRYGMPTLVGDPVKDAAQFAATSPLKQAARVTQPLLLAHGGADQRVPIYHGNKFHDAVKATNKNVEWVLYRQEGHGWKLVKTRVDFWGRVENFLQRQIGTAAQ